MSPDTFCHCWSTLRFYSSVSPGEWQWTSGIEGVGGAASVGDARTVRPASACVAGVEVTRANLVASLSLVLMTSTLIAIAFPY